MKKLVLFFIMFAMTISINAKKIKNNHKVEAQKTMLSQQNKASIGGSTWIVRMVSQDEMDCYSGGQSDCPIFWFLHQQK